MSLRDQLLKKGLASKKDARRSDRQAKKSRKQHQGAKQRKHKLLAEQRAKQAAEDQARTAERLAARTVAEQARDAHEHALQIRNLILGHTLKSRGDQPFWFKGPDRKTLYRMKLHPRIAEELARGNLAVACLDHGNRHEHVLIGRVGAEKLTALGAASVLLHWAVDLPRDDGDGLLRREWDVSMRPHRVKPS